MRIYCVTQGTVLSALNGKEIKNRENICTGIADSLWCTIETNTTL